MSNFAKRGFQKSLIFFMLFTACATVTDVSNVAVDQIQDVLPTSTIPAPPPTQTSAPVVEQPPSVVPSAEAINYLGQRVIVRIEHANCNFRADVNGAPTFCNDKPFPEHDFTLLVWGEDWGFLDGACIQVEGVIEAFEGRAEIIAEDLDQVDDCPE